MTITIEELYPDASEEERKEARRRFEAYVRLVLRIQDRLEAERVDGDEDQAYDECGRPH